MALPQGFRIAQAPSAHMIVGILIGCSLSSLIVMISIGQFRGHIRFRAMCHTAPLNCATKSSSHLKSTKTIISSKVLAIEKLPRVLCLVLTSPANQRTRAKAVHDTWARRGCQHVLFMSSATNATQQQSVSLSDNTQAEQDTDGAIHVQTTVALNVSEGHDKLWPKTRAAFQYAYAHYRYQADWFLKADDDTYVVVENLRLFLARHNSSSPIYFGCRFKPYVAQGYMSGGAGYVLSHAALKLLVEHGLSVANSRNENQNKSKAIDNACLPTQTALGQPEDVVMGTCLAALGVQAGDSRDARGRARFFALNPEFYLVPAPMDPKFWLTQYSYYPYTHGPSACSDTAISFHYVPPHMMYVVDYLLFVLRKPTSSSSK
ncbi:Glycoprotein-N-acetylgalactosamine 3-beta-galactosyltransferase 1 [Fragariocoptes setiger]|uniref:N-acetylgalactosaminide beta-1,3-galactosyltransferase n=1 Tax=Fragariocoptes setiger TaxID=1670756 RepID=A0ABQ7SCY7_9ACAR|nr:Glycoprotein-N-acetylgalactosamine 3-beta-galactosyltransferase 1 [Fragariocoptes setiger]